MSANGSEPDKLDPVTQSAIVGSSAYGIAQIQSAPEGMQSDATQALFSDSVRHGAYSRAQTPVSSNTAAERSCTSDLSARKVQRYGVSSRLRVPLDSIACP
jgi:hypothetical protein